MEARDDIRNGGGDAEDENVDVRDGGAAAASGSTDAGRADRGISTAEGAAPIALLAPPETERSWKVRDRWERGPNHARPPVLRRARPSSRPHSRPPVFPSSACTHALARLQRGQIDRGIPAGVCRRA